MLSLSEACARIVALAEPGEPIEVPLTEAPGLVLAEPAVADVDLPPNDRALHEGYAVRAADAARGALLRVVGTGRVHRLAEVTVEVGEAARIAAGAALPVGADAVVRTADTRPDPGTGPPRVIEVLRDAESGRHVLRRGAVLGAGVVLAPAGTRVRAPLVGLLAAQGCVHPVCHRRVRVAVVAVGDHLVNPVEPPGLHRERNAAGLAVLAPLLQAGAAPHDLGAVAPSQLRPALERALTAPVVLILAEPAGAISRICQQLGLETIVDGVELHPGKRLAYGVIRDGSGRVAHHVFRLPPGPVAAVTVLTLLVGPLIARLQGDPAAGPETITASWDGTHRSTDDRLWAVPVALAVDGEARCRARPLATRGPHDLPAFARADGLAILPARSGPWLGGELVEVVPLGPPDRFPR